MPLKNCVEGKEKRASHLCNNEYPTTALTMTTIWRQIGVLVRPPAGSARKLPSIRQNINKNDIVAIYRKRNCNRHSKFWNFTIAQNTMYKLVNHWRTLVMVNNYVGRQMGNCERNHISGEYIIFTLCSILNEKAILKAFWVAAPV